MQGCNLNCLYCHNPETQKLCSLCGRCVETCPEKALLFHPEKIVHLKHLCRQCDICLQTCPQYSSPKYYPLTAIELVDYILKYRDYLAGITFSGGECLLQTAFLKEASLLLKKSSPLTVFLDTNAYLAKEKFKEIQSFADGLMIDLKAFNPEVHHAITGVDNSLIMENLQEASIWGILYEVRTVIIRNVNDDLKEIENIARFIKNLNSYTFFKISPCAPYGMKKTATQNMVPEEAKFTELYLLAQKILGDRVKIPFGTKILND